MSPYDEPVEIAPQHSNKNFISKIEKFFLFSLIFVVFLGVLTYLPVDIYTSLAKNLDIPRVCLLLSPRQIPDSGWAGPGNRLIESCLWEVASENKNEKACDLLLAKEKTDCYFEITSVTGNTSTTDDLKLCYDLLNFSTSADDKAIAFSRCIDSNATAQERKEICDKFFEEGLTNNALACITEEYIDKQDKNGTTLLMIYAGNSGYYSNILNDIRFLPPSLKQVELISGIPIVRSKTLIRDILFSLNPNINLQNNNGDTVLHLWMKSFVTLKEQAQTPYSYIYQQLLERGADPDIKNNKGESPASLIEQYATAMPIKEYTGLGIAAHNVFLTLAEYSKNESIKKAYREKEIEASKYWTQRRIEEATKAIGKSPGNIDEDLASCVKTNLYDIGGKNLELSCKRNIAVLHDDLSLCGTNDSCYYDIAKIRQDGAICKKSTDNGTDWYFNIRFQCFSQSSCVGRTDFKQCLNEICKSLEDSKYKSECLASLEYHKQAGFNNLRITTINLR